MEPRIDGFTDDVAYQVELDVKYRGYTDRQKEMVERARRLEDQKDPSEIAYQEVSGLSREVVEKLSRVRPFSLGQASRIPGVTPASVTALMVHLKKTGALCEERVGCRVSSVETIGDNEDGDLRWKMKARSQLVTQELEQLNNRVTRKPDSHSRSASSPREMGADVVGIADMSLYDREILGFGDDFRPDSPLPSPSACWSRGVCWRR